MNLMSTAIIADQLTPGHWTANSFAKLAAVYRQAALDLLDDPRYRKRTSSSPARLLALQAIELYLSAVLLARGHQPADIRALQHDLQARHAMATEAGLILRRCTGLHLQALARNREYLVTRYHPEAAGQLSELNRLRATLEEVAGKVSTLLLNT